MIQPVASLRTGNVVPPPGTLVTRGTSLARPLFLGFLVLFSCVSSHARKSQPRASNVGHVVVQRSQSQIPDMQSSTVGVKTVQLMWTWQLSVLHIVPGWFGFCCFCLFRTKSKVSRRSATRQRLLTSLMFAHLSDRLRGLCALFGLRQTGLHNEVVYI